ncbi:MAG TPA: hypothetical protein VGG68_00610 [Caulobacteraceae bacterium]
MGKHTKPTDPQEIARRRAERAANEAEISRLRAQGAVVRLDRARRIVTAYRASPFVKLRDSNTISAAQARAAEALTEDWAIWRGLDGKPERLDVHVTSRKGGEVVTDRMLKAGERVQMILSRIGPLDRELLVALVSGIVEQDVAPPWREAVEQITGVTQSVRQSQMVVSALENLARVYRSHGRMRQTA